MMMLNLRNVVFVLLTTCVVLSSFPVSAAIYKWTDENGRVHFGDKPRTDNSAKQVSVDVNVVENERASHQSSSKSTAPSIDDIQLKRRLQKEAKKKRKQMSCKADREFLDKLTGTEVINGRVHFFYFEENGVPVTEARKREKISELRASLKKNKC